MEWRDKCAEQEKNRLERLHAVRNDIASARDEIADSIGSSQAGLAHEVSFSEDLRHLASFVGALRVRDGRLRQRSAECEVQIGAQTARCVEADRDHQLLVRLRERQLAAWRYEADRQDEQASADSWLSGHARKAGQTKSGEFS